MLQKLEIKDDSIYVSLLGEIDLKTSDSLRKELENLLDKHSGKELILDFQRVGFIDSSGLGVLLGRYKRIHTQGGKLSITNAQPQVKRILELSGISRLITVSDIHYK